MDDRTRLVLGADLDHASVLSVIASDYIIRRLTRCRSLAFALETLIVIGTLSGVGGSEAQLIGIQLLLSAADVGIRTTG